MPPPPPSGVSLYVLATCPRREQGFKTPSRGRFAFVPVMTNATDYSNSMNAYGLLRSPWNADRNPFVTRSDLLMGFTNNKKPSGCKKFRDAFNATNW